MWINTGMWFSWFGMWFEEEIVSMCRKSSDNQSHWQVWKGYVISFLFYFPIHYLHGGNIIKLNASEETNNIRNVFVKLQTIMGYFMVVNVNVVFEFMYGKSISYDEIIGHIPFYVMRLSYLFSECSKCLKICCFRQKLHERNNSSQNNGFITEKYFGQNNLEVITPCRIATRLEHRRSFYYLII